MAGENNIKTAIERASVFVPGCGFELPFRFSIESSQSIYTFKSYMYSFYWTLKSKTSMRSDTLHAVVTDVIFRL